MEHTTHKVLKWCYFFLFSNVVVLILGLIFLLVCYHGPFRFYKIYEPIPTLLTVIGFLFAFAGINIYSIFNTNIEAEKKALNDLSDEYRERLERSVESVEHSKNIVRMQINIGMIVDPPEASYEIPDMVDKILGLIDKAIGHIRENRKDSEITCEIEVELRDIAQYNKRKLSRLLTKINNREERRAYFRLMNEDKCNIIMNSLEKLNKRLADIVSGDIYADSDTVDVAHPISLWAKIKAKFLRFWHYGFIPLRN